MGILDLRNRYPIYLHHIIPISINCTNIDLTHLSSTSIYYKYTTQVVLLVAVEQSLLNGKETINAYIHLANYSNLTSPQYSCSITL